MTPELKVCPKCGLKHLARIVDEDGCRMKREPPRDEPKRDG